MKETVENVFANSLKAFVDQLIVVGVSGGPDSMALLHVLHACGHRLAVAHLDHGLRPEASKDAAVVQEFSEKLGLSFHTHQEDTQTFAKQHGMSIEEAARSVRYRFLSETAQEIGAKAIAVAHTADDQVETVLMHLLRGSGLAGLRGMQIESPNPYHASRLPVIRPLLAVWREEILAYCQDHDIQPVFDETNQDTTIYRNRIRHELVPYLAEYNPQVKVALLRMADTLQEDEIVLDQLVEQAWEACQVHLGGQSMGLDAKTFLNQPLGIQRRIARKAVQHLRQNLRDIDFAAVERMIAFIQSPTQSGKSDLIAGLELCYEEGEVWLLEQGTDLPVGDWPQIEQESLLLAVPGEVELANGWRITAEPVSYDQKMFQEIQDQTSQSTAWLATQSDQLLVRRKRVGDRFQPLGMQGHSLKLSDFFINNKIPQRARAAWPLVCVDDQIAWVTQQRLAEPFRLVENTRQVTKLELSKLDSI